MKRQILAITFLLLGTGAMAQGYYRHANSAWYEFRHELVGGIGTSMFMGDLGGGPSESKHFLGVSDIDLAVTRPSFHMGYRYRATEWLAFRSNFSYGIVMASDAETTAPERRSRNLSFKSNIYELSVRVEATILPEQRHRYYMFRRNRPKQNVNIYSFFGAGLVHFNPKAELEGVWYELQPLGTEGQGIDANPEPYRLFTLSVPIGVGFRYYINKNWAAGAEFSCHYTGSDYVDDVSGFYYDNDRIRATYGDLAATLADRREGEPVASGAQRGDAEYNDAYLFFNVTATYTLDKSSSRSSFGRRR